MMSDEAIEKYRHARRHEYEATQKFQQAARMYYEREEQDEDVQELITEAFKDYRVWIEHEIASKKWQEEQRERLRTDKAYREMFEASANIGGGRPGRH